MTDRDRSIERLLRRAGAPNDERATECLDAETLAALADDTLPAAARRDAEMHLADCGRCQALTAAMIRTEAAAGTTAVEVSRARRAFNWLVPAAAAAAAVGLWVLVPQRATPPAAPAISDQQVAAAPPASAVEAERRDSLESLESRATPQNEAAPTSPTATLADRPAPPPAELARSSPAALEERQEALKLEESASRDSAGNVQSPAPAATAPAAPAPAPVGGSLQASAPAAASAPARETGARESDAVAQQRAAAFSARPAFDIASPNPRIRWRVGPAGTVQRTEDQGVTWTSQQTGGAAELTAGSSPAADVCWIVGRGGIVLRTVDAGRSWQRAALPDAADAVAVAASTSVDAVVTLAGGRRVATSDGGRTWAPVP